jgi:Fe-Mn family superoxide dismutase
MDLQLRPLTLDPNTLDGLSARLITSHHENNYTGAVKRLNAIRGQLAQLDWAASPVFVVNGLKREELIAANSTNIQWEAVARRFGAAAGRDAP